MIPLVEIPYPDIDPVLVEIPLPFLGDLPIRWYALAYLIGLLGGWLYARALVRNESLWGERSHPGGRHIDDFLAWAALGVIAGGRLGYVLFYRPDLIWTEPLAIVQVWQGGMSFHGGLIGVILAMVLYARGKDFSAVSLGDAIAPVVPIGLLLGRIANFINAELYGRAWDGPWAMVFPTDPLGVPRHPSQLYEAASEGLLLLLILAAAVYGLKVLRRPGVSAGIFFAGYGLARALVELVREPDAHMPDFPLGLTMGMMLSLPMALIGFLLILRGFRTERQKEQAS